MASLTGMKGEGYYDRHSSFQRATFEAVTTWVEDAVARMKLPAEPAPIVVADYGCSEGKNSLVAVGAIVEALRRRCPTHGICAFHSDLPSNNFNRLFANLFDPNTSNYLQDRGAPRPNTFALAAGGSFYRPLFSAETVHFAVSILAVEWLDRLPEGPAPEFIGYMRGAPRTKEVFRIQAERDWQVFLEHRARELCHGGKLLVVIPGRNDERSTADGLYDLLNDACLDVVEAGLVPRAHYERSMMPVYFRSLEEMTAPLQSADSPFLVDRAETLEVPIPMVEAYRETGDLETYAREYAGFLRAFSEPVIGPSMTGPEGGHAIADAIYERVRVRVLREPERYLCRNIEVGVLLTKK